MEVNPTPSQQQTEEYEPQWLEPPLPAPVPRFQFAERKSDFFGDNNRLILGVAIGIILMGMLMSMRPVVIHAK